METKKYKIEIFGPGNTTDLLMYYKSSSPFMSIHSGDIINPVAWGIKGFSSKYVLQVKGVEHILWESKNEIEHKICLFTEKIENTAEIRLNKT